MMGIKKIFIEYGLDFDNNKYGLGRSTEIEYTDDTEVRTHEKIKMTNITERYVRIWIGRSVLIVSSRRPYVLFRKKNRGNFKIVCGKSGYLEQ